MTRTDRTFKNPRWYTVIPLFPVALMLWLPSLVMYCLAQILRIVYEGYDSYLDAFWRPYRQWVNNGIRK